MPENMRRGVIEIDCPADPLPSSDEGSFRDRPQAITDNKSVELPVRTQDIDQPLIKRNASFSSFTLGITKDGLVIVEGIIKNMGISILSRISVETEVRHGYLKTAPLEGVNLSRKWYIIHKKNHVLSPEDTLFIERILDKPSR